MLRLLVCHGYVEASGGGGLAVFLPDFRAVSYTHLDVYKRQIFPESRVMKKDLRGDSGWA